MECPRIIEVKKIKIDLLHDIMNPHFKSNIVHAYISKKENRSYQKNTSASHVKTTFEPIVKAPYTWHAE